MKVREVEFVLPIGYEDENENIYRNGRMRMATALDEIEIQNDERIQFNQRFRDCLMLGRVITKLGDFQSVSAEMVENLFEVDFIYLQMVYNTLNHSNQHSLLVRCPSCNTVNTVHLTDLFKNIHHYFSSPGKEAKAESSIQEISSGGASHG